MPRINSLLIAFFLSLALTVAADAQDRIVYNTVGYEADFGKRFLLLSSRPQQETTASLVARESGDIVDTATVQIARFDWFANEYSHLIEFAGKHPIGQYHLTVNNTATDNIEFSSNVYHTALITLLRSFYLQRCGLKISDSITGMQRPRCHVSDGHVAHPDSDKRRNIDGTGGWHDAGDYGKYVATTTVTIGNLLVAYELSPSYFRSLNLSLPESNNEIPDLLDEVIVGANWLVKMQRPDGALYRKLSGKKWPQLVAPHDDTQLRFAYGVSTSDTAKAAAALAMSARFLTPYEPRLSAIFLESAERAWRYAAQFPGQHFDYKEGDDNGSGPYRATTTDREESLTYDWDDRLWAAAELFVTTGKPEYKTFVAKYLVRASVDIFEWKNPSFLAIYQVLHHPQFSFAPELLSELKKRLLTRADVAVRHHLQSPYGIANQKFIWGSNKMTAEEGVLLMTAYRMSMQKTYLDAALDQLHYLFGKNYFGINFVTGLNAHSVSKVSHIYARAAEIDIPGLLVGGPNEFAQAGVAPKWRGAMSYIDDPRSYATNEYAIDYNASLISLIAHIQASISGRNALSYRF